MDPTPRQLKLLAMHSTGMSCEELGEEFHLSRRMIFKEFNQLRERLGAHNLYHAQTLALAAGLLAVDGREGKLFVVDREMVAA